MQTEFQNLTWKCYENDLRFEYNPVSNGIVISDDGGFMIGNAYLDRFSHTELELLSRKIDWYMNGEIKPNNYRPNVTEYERKLKEAGHRESDFV